jgi:hypothetical protein
MMLNDYVITIDVDWAPDWAIAEVANILIANNVKATWFITSDSQEIRKLFKNSQLFEVGLHPNFEKGSTQGKKSKEVMRYLTKIAPHAKSMRTHDLVQSSRLLKMVREDFDILYDVSLLLPETPNIIPHEIFFSKTKKGLLRFPFFWEDDVEMYRPQPCFSLTCNKYNITGLKIFNFHPIHIVLNSSDMNNYYSCKHQIYVTKCSLPDLQPYINTEYGTGTFFNELVKSISSNNIDLLPSGKTISQLAFEWRNKMDKKEDDIL